MNKDTCKCSDHLPCQDCKTPMRAKGTSESLHPGTNSSRQNGICNKCMYNRAQGYAPQNEHTLAASISTLNHYIQNRRQRGIPSTGLRITA